MKISNKVTIDQLKSKRFKVVMICVIACIALTVYAIYAGMEGVASIGMGGIVVNAAYYTKKESDRPSDATKAQFPENHP